ncbi:MAG: biotin--[acetyl-CoA-carboxylase] ligase [Synechococcus sp.]
MFNPIQFQESLRTKYCGRHLLQFCQLDSTNRLLADWAKNTWPDRVGRKLPEGTTAISARQMSGKGQRGHRWESSPGGLYASVLLYPQVAASELLELTLAVAWGIALQLRAWQALDVQLKWPNDLMLVGRKLGGVLLQSQLVGGHAESVVAGVGLNVYNSTPEVGISLLDVLGERACPDRRAIAQDAAMAVLAGIERGYEAWKQVGLAGLNPSYISLMVYRDCPITIGDRMGTVVGVARDGQLQVNLAGEMRAFQSGEVQLGYEL